MLLCQDNIYGFEVDPVPGAFYYNWYIDPPEAGVFSSGSNLVDLMLADDYLGDVQIWLNVSNNCGAGPFSDSLSLVVYDLPSSETYKDTTICSGDSAMIRFEFSGTPPYLFTWSDGRDWFENSTFNDRYSFYVSDGGSYHMVRLWDAFCKAKSTGDTAEIRIISSPVAEFDHYRSDMDVSFMNRSIYADSYFWDFGDGSSSTEKDPVHSYLSEGDYLVSLTASGPFCDEHTVIKEIKVYTELEDFVEIYPNPSDGYLILKTGNPNDEDLTVKLFNILGQNVHEQTFKKAGPINELYLNRLNDGLYVIELKLGSLVKIEKIMISK
jgi:PKD repeat protein